MTTVATLANMRKARALGIDVVAYDWAADASYSADPADYFYLSESDPLTGEDDVPLVLVRRIRASYTEITEGELS